MSKSPIVQDLLIKPAFIRPRFGRVTVNRRGDMLAKDGVSRLWNNDDPVTALQREIDRFIVAKLDAGSTMVDALKSARDELAGAHVPANIADAALDSAREHLGTRQH